MAIQFPLWRPRGNRLAGYASSAIPGEDAAINPAHFLSPMLAFLFVPTATGFRDLVRGDVMSPVGTVTPILSPFGPSWVLGVAAGGVGGGFTTIGGDNYYQPPTAHMSIAAGIWNQASIVNSSGAIACRLQDTAGNNDIRLDIFNSLGIPVMRTIVTIGGSGTAASGSGGATAGLDTANQVATLVGTFDGSTIHTFYGTKSLGYGTIGNGSASKSGTPSGMNTFQISNSTVGNQANRVVLWAAGWYRTLTASEYTYLAQGPNWGGLPQGLLIQRNTRLYSFAPSFTPLQISGIASTTTTGQISSTLRSLLKGEATTDVRGQSSTKLKALIAGEASANTSASLSTKTSISLIGYASLDTEAGALVRFRNRLTGSALIDPLSISRVHLLPTLTGSKALNLTPASRLLLSSMAGNLILPIFPTLPPLAWSVHKKPIMASRVTTAITGRETQLAGAAYPRWAFTLTYGGSSWLREQTQNIVPDPQLLGLKELEQLSGLFLYCLGPYGEFYYEDPDDNSRSGEAVGIGNGTTRTFPLFFSWGFGPFTPSFTSPVGGIKIINSVYFDGVPQAASSYVLDFTNTQLIFMTAPTLGKVITADFYFYFRCRFLDDHMEFSQFARNLWECKEVRFESVKA